MSSLTISTRQSDMSLYTEDGWEHHSDELDARESRSIERTVW